MASVELPAPAPGTAALPWGERHGALLAPRSPTSSSTPTRRAGRRAYKAKIAGLERKVGQPTMELGLPEKGLRSARRASGGVPPS